MHRFRRVCPMRWSRLCPCSMRIRIAPFPIIVVGTVDLSTYKAGCMYDRKMWACTDVPYTHAYVYGRLYKRMHSHYYGSIVKVSVLFRSASFIWLGIPYLAQHATVTLRNVVQCIQVSRTGSISDACTIRQEGKWHCQHAWDWYKPELSSKE